MLRPASFAVLAFALAVPVTAQDDDCETGFTTSDDGIFENGYGASAAGSPASYVMRFTPPPGHHRITAVCVCWTRTNALLSAIAYDIEIWPGDTFPSPFVFQSFRLASADSVPLFSSQVTIGEFTRNNVFSVSVTGPVFVGPRWDTALFSNFFVCADEDGPGGAGAASLLGDRADAGVR